MKGTKNTTLKNIYKDIFDISESYASNLRWFGKTVYRYQKLSHLSLSCQEKKYISHMLRYKDLADKWKIGTEEVEVNVKMRE